LKQGTTETRQVVWKVAPRVGAWIETHYLAVDTILGIVAPRVGAWIETAILMPSVAKSFVAPRVGAWIETSHEAVSSDHIMSLLAWERGLKHTGLQARGNSEIVAPRVGAWMFVNGTKNIILSICPKEVRIRKM